MEPSISGTKSSLSILGMNESRDISEFQDDNGSESVDFYYTSGEL